VQIRSCSHTRSTHLTQQRAVAALILVEAEGLHAHATTQAKGNGINSSESTFEFITIVGGQVIEHHQQVDVAFRSSLAASLGTEQHDTVQPVAKRAGKSFSKFIQ